MKTAWWAGWLALVFVAPVSGCSDDDSNGTPDVVEDQADTPVDTPAETEEDDAGRPDEPIGPGDYPAGPYGRVVGDRLENLQFIDIDGNPLDLADIYADHSVKLLWIYATAGWCSVCGVESRALPGLWTTYNPQGLQILAVVFEDGSGNPAGVSYARSYASTYRFDFPVVADEPFVLGLYFDKAATPMNMLVDLTDMEILEIVMGWDASGLESSVQRYLSSIADRG